jgi:CRP/FNR family cyclic AMP-dependent transcriptional regulator
MSPSRSNGRPPRRHQLRNDPRYDGFRESVPAERGMGSPVGPEPGRGGRRRVGCVGNGGVETVFDVWRQRPRRAPAGACGGEKYGGGPGTLAVPDEAGSGGAGGVLENDWREAIPEEMDEEVLSSGKVAPQAEHRSPIRGISAASRRRTGMTPLLDAVDFETIPLFRGLTPAEQRPLHDLLGVSTFPAGAEIVTAEEPGDVAYIVLEGTVKVQVHHPDGTAVILAILRAGEIAGEMSLVDRLGRSAAVVAMEQTTLAWLTNADFWHCLRSMPTMAFNLAGILSRRLRLSNAHVVALATLDIEGRLADQLLALGAEYGEATANDGCRIPFRLTQGDLAALVGASRVRVNQILVKWKHNKFLAVDGQHVVTLLDRRALTELVPGLRAEAPWREV